MVNILTYLLAIMKRNQNRPFNSLREITIETNINKYAEGSCLISFGNTKVICTASVDNKVPIFKKNSNEGWITAEYSMLPRSTHDRIERESIKGKQTGRTQEIQRLIGRSLRSVVDLSKLGERQIKIDCDVIQADGGTRVASICGGYIALCLACNYLFKAGLIQEIPIIEEIGAISCGIINGIPMVDLDYAEDSKAQTDANFVITNTGRIVEIQVSAEQDPLSKEDFAQLWHLAEVSIEKIINIQRQAILQAIEANE